MKATILIDSRERKNLHILKRLTELNQPFRIVTMKYADYSFEWNGVDYRNLICVERKANLTELCGNLAKGKIRFEKEFSKAKVDKCKVVLMIEDGSWEKIEKSEYRSKFSPAELTKRIKIWVNHFQLELKFVEKSESCDFMLDCFKKYLDGGK